jgi:hypothetical protein
MRLWWTLLVVGCSGDSDPDGPDASPPGTGDTTIGTDTADTATTDTGEQTVDGYRCHGGACLLVRSEVDEGDDGTLDRVEDLFVLQPERIELRFDGNGDGVPDTRYALYDHDEACQRTEEVLDDDRDGLDDKIARFTWDGGLLVSDEVDLPGITSWSTTYTHDAGQVVREDRDDRQDGTVDVITTRSWDQDRKIREEIDQDADGTADLVRFWAYDTSGRLLSQQTDYAGDGTVDEVVSWTWDDDRPLRAETDLGADGVVEQLEAWVYDATGALVEYRRDTNNDGNPELRVSTTRDGDGQPVEERTEEDLDSDGVVDRSSVVTRVFSGDLPVEEAADTDGDGDIDERAVLTWSCPS